MKSTVERVDIEELFKILSEEAPMGSCIMQDGRFCYINSFFSSDTGYTANELVGKDSFKIVVPEDREMVRENTVKMLKGELTSPYQFRVICKDGSIRWVMAAVKSVQYHGRRAILGNYMEATEHKKIEDAMRENEERYRVLSEEAPAGVCIMQDGRFCYVNSKFPIAIGYTVDELVGKDSLEIVVPEDREMVRENTIKMLKGELTSPYQFRVICKDGSIIWVMAAVESIQYHGRRAILGSYMEVTERKQMEETLKEREERYRELANSITDVFFAMDEHLRYTYWNKASEVLTGIRAEYAIGKSLREIFPDTPWRRRAEKVYRKVLKTRQPQIFLNDYDIDDRHYIFEISAYPSRGGISVFVKDITEHKQAEEKLKESEQKYRTILEEMGDGYFEADLAGNFTFVNDAEARLLGYSKEELIGKNYRAFTPKENAKPLFEAYNRMYKTGEPLRDFSREIIRKDGTHGFAQSSAFPIRNDKGEIIGFRGVRHDITEHKQAEKKLKESEQKYRLLFETSPDCIAQLDREGKYLAANPAVAKSLGVPLEELVGKTVFEVVPQEIAQHRLGMVRKALDEWQLQIFEDERAGRYFHHIVIPTENSEQKEAVQVITRDITERKQADEKLKESEQKYRLLFETSLDCIAQLDREGRYLTANPATARSLGVPLEELLGKTIFEVVPQEVAQHRLQMLRKTLGEWQPQIFEDERAGRYFSHIYIPTKISEQKEAIYGIARDITERREMEETLRQSEEKHRALFDSSVIGMFVMDAETMKIVMANKATARMMGFSSVEEAIGINPIDLVHPEDKDKALEITIEEMFERDLRRTHEYRVVNKDGREGWVSVTGARIMHEGRLAGLVSITDITERKQAVEALRQSEERYRTMLEEMEDAYSEVDLGGHFTFVNNSVCRYLGYSREELMGMSYKKFTDEDDIESVFRAFNEVYRTDVPNKGFSWKTIRKDGTQGFAETSVSPLRNDKGEIIGFRCVGRDVSERKQAEEKLQRSRERYRALFDSSVTGTLVVDAETMQVVIGNQAAVKMFGFSSAEEGAGVNLLDFVLPEEKEKALELIKKELFEKNSRRAFDLQAVTKDGRKLWISATGARIMHKGRLAGLLSFTDVTERKEAEEKLRQSEENYKILFNSSVVGMYVMDAETMKVVMGNPAAREMVGFSSAEEGIGINPFDFVVPEDREKVLEIAINEFLQDSRQTHEIRVMDKNGRRGWQSISIARIMHKGRLASLVSFTDITERKRMEEALRQSEENYRALFDSSVIGTIVIDAETMKVVMANQAAAKMFGFSSAEEGIGVNPLDFVPPDDRGRVSKIIVKDMFEQDLRQTNELHVLTKDGREIWISASGARITHEGRIAGLISFTDITEQKRQREQLMMTDRLASLGELAAGTAHELNNPLTSVIGLSQLLMEREGPDDVREDLKLINNEAQRAASVTKNLLTFARKHAPVKQPTQINNIIEDVLKLRAYEHKANSIKVERQLAPDLPEIMADYFQIQQVFLNIIINAEYFMGEGHKRGTLTITTKKQNNTVIISFADDGPGIPPENLRRIFDPFFTTKEAGKGTGLGLSICHGIVSEHGGQIYARSQPDKGATFVVELPINSH